MFFQTILYNCNKCVLLGYSSNEHPTQRSCGRNLVIYTYVFLLSTIAVGKRAGLRLPFHYIVKSQGFEPLTSKEGLAVSRLIDYASVNNLYSSTMRVSTSTCYALKGTRTEQWQQKGDTVVEGMNR